MVSFWYRWLYQTFYSTCFSKLPTFATHFRSEGHWYVQITPVLVSQPTVLLRVGHAMQYLACCVCRTDTLPRVVCNVPRI